jgi:hypothetical protein
MPRIHEPPAALQWESLRCTACFDYVKVICPIKYPLPPLRCSYDWVLLKSDRTIWTLTLHDPCKADIELVAHTLMNPMMWEMELSLDLRPKPNVCIAEYKQLLEATHRSVAGRYRPEDSSLWHHGTRGAVTERGKQPVPFHTRFPAATAQLIYGRKIDWMQAKVYLKNWDLHAALPTEEHSVRLELRLGREALQQFRLNELADLVGFSFRKTFTAHFRFIERPEIRSCRGQSAKEYLALEKKMKRAWATAGVGKFAPNTSVVKANSWPNDLKKIAQQAKKQLAYQDYRLRRDQKSNAKVGAALQLLDKRMVLRNSISP